MTALRLESGLLFVTMTVRFADREEAIPATIVDTGSATTLISTQVAERLGIEPALGDPLNRVRGIGGIEWTYSKRVSQIAVGEMVCPNALVEVSGGDYGFGIEAILGLDFLCAVGAVIDLKTRELRAA